MLRLVNQVLQSADERLTVRQVFTRVNNLVPIRTVNPLTTVRGALSHGAQLARGQRNYGR